MGLHDFTFYDLVNRNAQCFKERAAWLEVDDGRTLTFGQYKEQVDRLACGLQNSGVEKGDRIGVLGKNSLEYFLLYGGAAALGAIMLPINWRLSAEEVAFNLNDCEPKVVFADEEYQELIDGVKKKLPSVEKYFNLKARAGNYLDFEALLDNQGDFNPPEVCTDDGYVIIHTAAVAGRPRGALLSHGNILCADMHFDYFFSLMPEDVNLNLLPLFHVGGLFTATTSFHAGALNVNMSKFDAAQAVELIKEKKVSLLFDFAPILSSILEAHEESGIDIGTLKTVAGLDTPETIEKYQDMVGGTFYCMYGQTETSCVATFSAYNDKPGSAGRAIPLSEVRLVDDYDRPVPPEENEYTFREGWHHTGDMGRFDKDGFLFYAGRKAEKELIKPGGENVYPAEVEKVILQHPAIEKTVVFGVPDPKWKEGIKAVCQLKEGQSLESKELIDFVKTPVRGVYIRYPPIRGWFT
jgi:long-chain acyl-CoA synthetase